MTRKDTIERKAAVNEKVDRICDRADQLRNDIFNKHEELRQLNEIIIDVGYDLYCIKADLECMDD